MSRSPIGAWRAASWAVLRGGDGPAFSEAAAILAEGLAALGVDASAGDDGGVERLPIVLNSSGRDSSGYAFRAGEERMEFFGESDASLPVAAAAFLELLGTKRLAPDFLAGAAPRIEGGGSSLSSSSRFPALVLVLREPPSPERMPSLRSWARSRGFASISAPRDESSAPEPDSGGGSAGSAVVRAGAVPGFVEESLRLAGGGTALPILVVDDGERCRAHPLDDLACERNAAFFSPGLDSALAKWRKAGGKVRLRLRYDDDLVFPVPCPPQTALIARDLAWASERGLDGIEYVASIRLPDRPSINAWVFSALAFPPPKGERAAAGDRPSVAALELEAAAAREEFMELEAAAGRAAGNGGCSAQAASEYYARLETAWAQALDRGVDEGVVEGAGFEPFGRIRGTVKELTMNPPAWPLDPWNECRERQERRAAALSEAYAELDRCAELLDAVPAFEAPAFRAHEAAIELAGVMRALYAEEKGSGSPSGLAMMAEGALIVLRRRLAALYRPGELPASARKFLVEAYRFRLAGLYNKGSRGPMGALRSAIFKLGLLAAYR